MACFSGRHVDIRTGMGASTTSWEGQNTYPLLDGVIYGINSGKGLAIRSSSSVSQDGLIYLGTYDHHVYCVDGKTGEVLWKVKTGAPVVSSACIADAVVFIGSDDGKVYALEGE